MNINYQSDFKIIERLMPDAPFRFTYYIGKDKGSVIAEYDGQSYSGCFVDDERLIVPVDGGTLGIGNVMVKREYFLDDKAFSDGVCNLVSVEGTDIELGRGRTDSDIEADVEVGVFYKAFTFDDMTEEQKQEIADRVPTKEAERERAEAQRVEAEKGRVAAEAVRQATFDTNEEARQSTFDANEEKREEAEAKREERIDEAIASIANKVDRDDNAPKLTAGFANNLVGRGEATKEDISFRPSGGDTSIEDGTARIERLKGNTVAWNQVLNITEITAQFEKPLYTADLSEGIITVSKIEGGTNIYDQILCYFSHNFVSAHQYLIIYNLKRNDGQNTSHSFVGNGIYDGTTYHRLISTNGKDYKFFSPTESFTSTLLQISQAVTAGAALSYTIRPVIYDLTQMFGAGNEPTTIEEFNARKPIGIDEYTYNEGELISTTADEIKSVGFNAWDEEWEKGSLSPVSGEEIHSDILIRAKNYIPILPSTIYYCSNENIEGGDATWAMFFDEQRNLIKGYKTGRRTSDNAHDMLNHSFTTPATARYMRFYTRSKVYNHDICIHLAHTGYRNGEYEPYKEFRRSIPIKDIKDNDGNQLFPNGLLSAGSVCDEVTATKAIKRVGVVDMGNLDWLYQGDQGWKRFRAYIADRVEMTAVRQARFAACLNVNMNTVDNIIDSTSTKYIYISDWRYTDAASIKSSLQGVMLYYELSEPIEVDLPEPLNLDYEVSDFGTEEVLSSEPTTPMKADIIYQFNAVDRIRDNSRHTAEADKKLADYEARIAALEAIVTSLTSGEV